MDGFRSVWEPQQKLMQMAIPLLMQKKQHEEELRMKETALQVAAAKLEQEKAEKQDELVRKAQEAQIKYTMDMYKSAYEGGDQAAAAQFGAPLEAAGLPVAKGPAPGPYNPGMAPLNQYLTAPKKEDGLTGTAKNLEVILGHKPTLEELKKYGQDEANPYYSVVQTSTGLFKLNHRTGELAPLGGGAGQPLLPIAADVDLASAKTTAEKTAEATVQKQTTYPKVRESYKGLSRQWDLVESQIDKAIEAVNPFTAGVGSWLSVVPATPQKNLKETLKTIQANVGFDKLQDMRNNSPTGGALGQVSDLENKLLQAVQGSLDQSQSPAQLKENLRIIKSNLQQLRAQKDFAFKFDYKDIIEKESSKGPQGGTVEGGYRFKGGDPADSKNWEKVKQ